MHPRSSIRFSAWIVIAAVAALLLAPSVSLVAAPVAPNQDRILSQADEATPPLIEPVGESDEENEQDGLLAVSITEDIGDGGQPEGFPREISVGESRFLFDRMIPLQPQDMTRIGQEASLIVYAFTGEAPFDAVYVSQPDGIEDVLARFLPQRLDLPDVACPSEAVNVGTLDAGGTIYIFAGIEADLSTDVLQEVGTTNGRSIYSDPNAEQPFPELFIDEDAGLLRFVITTEEGRPASIAESLAFEGSVFEFEGDVTDQVAAGTLEKAGCAGPWPVLVDQTDSASRYVRVGGRLFQFTGETAPVDPPTEAPTDVPTEPATEEPTEAPTEEPTEVPVEAATEEPTAEPTESPTEAPTESPTEAPTEIPSEVPTEGVTEEAATEEIVTEEAAQATEEPTEEPTPTPEATEPAAPTATPPPTPEPTVPLQPPAVVPTQDPNAPPPPAVTAESSTTCSGSPGPNNAQGLPSYLPSQLQFGGIAYAFAGTQAQDEAGELMMIGCVGAFELLVTDQADRSEVVYLRYDEDLYRFESALTFNVEFEVVGQPQRIGTDEQQFRLVDTWVPSVYSSTTVILFVAEPEDTQPEVFYALNVYNNVVGDVIGEYRLAEEDTPPSSELTAAAEQAGINPDLMIEGRRYLLANVFVPVGTTTNGFVTLFAPNAEGEAELLLGRDMRRLELFIYNVIPEDQEGG